LQEGLIGEFIGRNTVYKVLPNGKFEVSNEGTGKLLGLDASLISTAVGTLANGLFMGELNSIITTNDGGKLMMKSNASWQSEKDGVTHAASIQTTQSTTLMRLSKAICLHEYVTDAAGNWIGKIYQWK
jgi:hypothetical protein